MDTKNYMESYYRIPSVMNNDFVDTERALVVNCTGLTHYAEHMDVSASRVDYYCFYLTDGDIRISEPIEALMHPGDLIIYAPNTPFRYNNEDHFSYYWVHFTGNAAAALLADAKIESNRVYSPGVLPQAISVVQTMFELFKYRAPVWEAEVAIRLAEFLLILGKNMMPDPDKNQHFRSTAAYMQKNFARPITVGELAEMAFMSINGYSAKFKQCFGMTPTAYIIAMRIRYAEQLLLETDLPVGAVAVKCGFSDPYYFSRLFARKTGMSPSVFRKQKRENRRNSESAESKK